MSLTLYLHHVSNSQKLVIRGRTLSVVNMHRISNSPKLIIRGRTCIMAERCQQATLNVNTSADRVRRNQPCMFVCRHQNNTNSLSACTRSTVGLQHGFVKSPQQHHARHGQPCRHFIYQQHIKIEVVDEELDDEVSAVCSCGSEPPT
eukprot:163930-Amphidinium_carterae.1